MKRTICAFLSFFVLCTAVFSLSACAGGDSGDEDGEYYFNGRDDSLLLAGTYSSEVMSLAFDNGMVTVTDPYHTGNARYTVTSENSKMYITFTFESGAYDFDLEGRYQLEKNGNSIRIGGQEFVKQ